MIRSPRRCVDSVRWESSPWFLFERLGSLFGRDARPTATIVLLTSVFFGLVNYPEQGLTGAEQSTITGLVFGTLFAVTGEIWLPMFTHIAFDLTAVAIIYFDLEWRFANLLIR